MERHCWVTNCYDTSYIKNKDSAPICERHYQRQRRTGKPTENLQGKRTDKMANIDSIIKLDGKGGLILHLPEKLCKDYSVNYTVIEEVEEENGHTFPIGEVEEIILFVQRKKKQ
jgi:hypothetical protein